MEREEIVARYMDSLPAETPQFVPARHPLDASAPTQNVMTPSAPRSVVHDLTSFLLKKDLLTSRFISFNDQPMAFAAWKTSFQAILLELQASPGEELDLLIKWLGTESKRFATSMKTANPKDPQRAVRLIWQRLQERYGSPELVEAALKSKLEKFPVLTSSDSKRLYELADILAEIASAKEDSAYKPLLSYFDSSTGILPIVKKLPHNIQEKWITRASNHKRQTNTPYPSFKFFVDFVLEMSQIRNDPGLCVTDRKREQAPARTQRPLSSKMTSVGDKQQTSELIDPRKKCPLHKNFHALNKCRTFRNKGLKERKDILIQHRICFKCCNSTDHVARTCTEDVICSICSSKSHPSALHVNDGREREPQRAKETHGGERSNNEETEPKLSVSNKCARICNNIPGGKSCSKTLLVRVYPEGNPEKAIKLYALVDDQSNRSLGKSELFDILGIHSERRNFALKTCSGENSMESRVAKNLVVSSLDGNTVLKLPAIVECDAIPDNREEIPTPEIAEQFPHLSEIAQYIPPLDCDAKILLLIGRDLIEAHHVLEHRIGKSAPYAQKLSLGWTIIGETCLNKAHLPSYVTANKTYLQGNGRPSILLPCESNITVQESGIPLIDKDVVSSVFERTPSDDKPGLSRNDRTFLDIMDRNYHRNEDGKWTAPLPFKPDRARLPNNYSQAVKRAKNLDSSLRKNPTKMEHAITFMQRIFENGHAELAPPLLPNEECWYLPIFAIYHPRKPSQIRMVFDSSALFGGTSLNSTLLSGPDLTNSLLGVLLRFRKETIAITADVEQMFYCFKVRKEDQNFLRFLWYMDNDPSKELTEFKMTVHVFGNTTSPSVAAYGLRKSVEISDTDVREFVHRNFYVDDALASLPNERHAIDLLTRTRQALMSGGKLRLHKIASNSQEVMDAFPEEDRAKDLKNLDMNFDEVPLQKSLGLSWDIQKDVFKFDVLLQSNPFSKRGMLATLNSLYDPIGFVSPVVLRGKIMFRNVLNSSYDWDDPLPLEREEDWKTWCDSLADLAHMSVPRTYASISLQECSKLEVHIFCDASETAISAVAYLKTFSKDRSEVGFLLGKSKLAPTHGHTIPRLELCAAVLGAEVATTIQDNLDVKIDQIRFYSDSRIVLGYIYNKSRRFYTYVSNRVHKILQVSSAEQWHYVQSEENPADICSRSIPASDLPTSKWIKGPTELAFFGKSTEEFGLVEPDSDKNVRPEVSALKTSTSNASLGIGRFERFSSWNSLVRAISFIRSVVLKKRGMHCDKRSVEFRRSTEIFIVKTVQRELLNREWMSCKSGKPVPRDSPVLSLDPYMEDDLLRVGGRLKLANTDNIAKHPIIIPGKSHVSRLLIKHYHDIIHHQGRHITEGAVRSAGYWIIGGKKLVSSVLYRCVLCRKLRGRFECQKMADLPSSRLQPAPPFTYVGVDMFGHWDIVTRKTRGGVASNKRWAILFTCLTSRATHIEVVEDMSASAFINALRRFVAIRGKVAEFRSDRGTNFVGCTDDLEIDAVNVEDSDVKDFLYNNGCKWIFNTPHSSHMGGVWERIIGLARRILDAILLKLPQRNLTHDVLVTLMAEICAILNNRPLVPVSVDPNHPFVLSPSTLLTQKCETDIPPFEHLDIKDMYASHWKHVQVIANQFWNRWQGEYIQLLQSRRKWKDSKENVKTGDVVLLRDKDAHRNEWPLGVIHNVFPDADAKVRKVEIRVSKNGQIVHYMRPVNEIVMLLPQ
ncbi:hypothetical protein FSP39_004706 [Pinctada imbricata]|uniref:Integrase catalytic domain-containing protein n=1 Tax=Pinctada imbricata TaxID=66713 RepID=A0AA88YTJ0_PINIB|nr:hypothetical protein FSP39_004706 [Pinctada imbricata]